MQANIVEPVRPFRSMGKRAKKARRSAKSIFDAAKLLRDRVCIVALSKKN